MPRQAELGARIATYSAAKAKYWLIPVGLLLFVGGAFAAIGPWLYPDPRAGLGTEIFVSVLGLSLMALGAAAALRVVRNRNRRVHLHENGIVEERGTRYVDVLWTEVETLVSVRQRVTQAAGLVTHTIEAHTLRTHDGKKLLVDHLLENIGQLGQQVEVKVTQALLPRITERLGQGAIVSFAPLRVTAKGIARGTDVLPWERVAGAEVACGEVRIFGHGEPRAWAKVAYGRLNNARALLELISSRVNGACA